MREGNGLKGEYIVMDAWSGWDERNEGDTDDFMTRHE